MPKGTDKKNTDGPGKLPGERMRLGRYKSSVSGRGVSVTVPSEYVALTGLGMGTEYEVFAEPDGSLLYRVTGK